LFPVVPSIRVHGRILVAGRAECLCVDVPAPITPEIPTAAVFTEGDLTAVAQDDGHFLLADLTEFLAVGDNHGERFS